jgi:hypothetical protein
MPDDLSKRAHININQPHDLRYWADKFGITPDELRAVVNKVGTSVKAAEQELAGRA